MSEKHAISVMVNDERREARVPARLLLADLLREEFDLTGTHLGCEHGVCGTCTVVLDGELTRSCLVFAVQADGCTVRTVEGLTTTDQLTPVQQAFNDNHGMQCGFCTSGFLISVTDMLDSDPDPSEERICDVLGGHICRCTGYQNIVAAVRDAAAVMRDGGRSA